MKTIGAIIGKAYFEPPQQAGGMLGQYCLAFESARNPNEVRYDLKTSTLKTFMHLNIFNLCRKDNCFVA
jgi:hypothetical protein